MVVRDNFPKIIKCGKSTGIIAIKVSHSRGSFQPKLSSGKYGVAHTTLGNNLRHTMRITTKTGDTFVILGIYKDEWLEGLKSCILIQPSLDNSGTVQLLADGSELSILPSDCEILTPLYGDGHPMIKSDNKLWNAGIVTLRRTEIEELLLAFDPHWKNIRPTKLYEVIS